MPIYEIECRDCGRKQEVLVFNADSMLTCPECGSADTEKLMSATSSLTGRNGQEFPGPADHTCCGSSPAQADCAGPGSCCGKAGVL